MNQPSDDEQQYEASLQSKNQSKYAAAAPKNIRKELIQHA